MLQRCRYFFGKIDPFANYYNVNILAIPLQENIPYKAPDQIYFQVFPVSQGTYFTEQWTVIIKKVGNGKIHGTKLCDTCYK
jgi:hypothetical protein